MARRTGKPNPTDAFLTGRGERVSYAVYTFGQLCAYIFIYMFLQIYLTDIGISATAVGAIFIAARVWDAVNDPMFGVIVNRGRLKSGKYLPWIRIATALVPALTALLFVVPSGLDGRNMVTAAAILYIVWGMSYTICDVPYFSLATMMTDNLNERNRIIANARTLMMVASMVVAIAVPLIYPKIGWTVTGIVIALLTALGMFPLCLTAKERYREDTQNFPGLREMLSSVIRNKYLLIFCLAFIVAGLTNASASISGYFAIHCLGGPEMMSVMSLISIVPSMAVIALFPVMARKIDKFYIFMGSLAFTIILSVPIYFIGYANIPLFIGLVSLRSIVSTVSSGTILPMFILDCAEYGRYRSGVDATAISVSLQTFTNKIYVAITGATGMFILGAAGFVSGENAVQPQSAIDMLWIMSSILPIIGQILSFIILFFWYKLRDKDVEIMAKVNRNEMTKSESLKYLSGRYSKENKGPQEDI
ncbi:MAG: glycoside-pentoside-hexuronide (GPH):cation symporter [Clostridiales Family XIII bacterium]|jgi:probable glucitol transport protein GutA|nr:glycoside-pentoside-hexuronide (GPH):cation symporter [Clostridiales Family XIII bacterium]